MALPEGKALEAEPSEDSKVRRTELHAEFARAARAAAKKIDELSLVYGLQPMIGPTSLSLLPAR